MVQYTGLLVLWLLTRIQCSLYKNIGLNVTQIYYYVNQIPITSNHATCDQCLPLYFLPAVSDLQGTNISSFIEIGIIGRKLNYKQRNIEGQKMLRLSTKINKT